MEIEYIRNQYSFINKIELLYRLLLTKLFFPKARLIRKGFEIRGKNMIDLGQNLTTGKYCRIEAFLTGNDSEIKIHFGHDVQINDNVHISALASVRIGNNVLIASHCYISDNSHGLYAGGKNDTSPEIKPIKRPYTVSQVKIGSNVWLGEGVIIMPGVTIGDGAIIGAHSIVNKSVPSNCIAAGSPAKIIKIWNKESKHWEKYNL